MGLKTAQVGDAVRVDEDFWEWCRVTRKTSLALIEESRRFVAEQTPIDLFASSQMPTQPSETALPNLNDNA